MKRLPHKSIRVFLTESCNANCMNCFNKSARTDSEMNIEDFDRLCKYLIEADFTSLKIMGGEPTTHTCFSDMISIAQHYFRNIAIFTNAINDCITKITPREKDVIVYNMNFEPSLTPEKIMTEKPGKRTIKIQINERSNVDQILSMIYKWRAIDKRVKPSFTFDCMTNIFEHKTYLTSCISSLEEVLSEKDIPYDFDHRVPLCFLLGCKEKMSYPGGICKVENSGLIDSSLNLRYCNQHHDKVLNLVKGGSFIDWEIAKNYLLKYYYQQQIQIMDQGCINCRLFGDYCNGGCWGKFMASNNKQVVF